MLIKSNEVILVSGQRRVGKTTFIKEKLIPPMKRTIIYDTAYDFTKKDGLIINNPEMIKDLLFKYSNKIIFQPLRHEVEVFDAVCKNVFWRTTNTMFVVEELADFCTTHKIPPNFSHLVRVGGHKGHGIIGVTQRPPLLNNLFRSQTQHGFYFAHPTIEDKELFKKWFGKEIAEKIYTLPKFNYFYNSPETQNFGGFKPSFI